MTPLQGSKFQVEWPRGPRTYESARQTIIALVNRSPEPDPDAYDPHLTFDRYFRRGRYQRKEVEGPTTLDLFRPSPSIAIRNSPPKVRPKPTLTVFEPDPPKVEAAEPLGIDLAVRGIEVRKLFYAGFARRVLRYGYDPEDVLQKVYEALLVRNNGKCPFDRSKSSFGHYVHMVCSCTLSNYHRRWSRFRRNEVFGVSVLRDGASEMVDVAEADSLFPVDAVQDEEAEIRSAMDLLSQRVERAAETNGYDPQIASQCIHWLYDGRRNKEIVQLSGLSANKVSGLVKLVRSLALETLV